MFLAFQILWDNIIKTIITIAAHKHHQYHHYKITTTIRNIIIIISTYIAHQASFKINVLSLSNSWRQVCLSNRLHTTGWLMSYKKIKLRKCPTKDKTEIKTSFHHQHQILKNCNKFSSPGFHQKVPICTCPSHLNTKVIIFKRAKITEVISSKMHHL